MADCQKERDAIKNVYAKSSSWAAKVDKMQDGQVIAIYNKFRAQGKLGR